MVVCTCSFQRGSDQPEPSVPAHVYAPPRDQCHSSLGQTSTAAKMQRCKNSVNQNVHATVYGANWHV